MLPTSEELGIGLVPYILLVRGYLTGKVNENTTFADSDIRSRNPRFTAEAIKANQGLSIWSSESGMRRDRHRHR